MQTPKYTQPEVLLVTRLKADVLQTWVNRKVIELADHTPGSGRRRLYSKADIVKLAIMRRMADLQVALAVSKEIAEGTVARLLRDTPGGSFPWDFLITLRPRAATHETVDVTFVTPNGQSPLAKYSPIIGDPRNIRLAALIEPPFNRRRPAYDANAHEIDESLREAQARLGIHAEPVIVIPLGEIVNGTLAQLRAMDEAEQGA